jgi:hypothetical protein
MDIAEIVSGGVNWFHLAQDRGQCRAVVKTEMNLEIL